MSFIFDEELLMGVATGLMTGIPSALFGIAAYVLTALALYSIACRRGLNKPWLAWIPVVNCWILGSLSDQYRYVVKGENKSKRKAMLILRLLSLIIGVMIMILVTFLLVQVFSGLSRGVSEARMMQMVMGPAVGILGLCLPLCGLAIAYAIIRYMALYDLYKSMDPNNCVVFLVLSILLRVTEPFFLFFSRDKDVGMPPRRQDPVFQAPPQQEPWETNEKDYL
ncbi:MAG: hypothetical protein ACI4PH_07150 [Faecousia sp.]